MIKQLLIVMFLLSSVFASAKPIVYEENGYKLTRTIYIPNKDEHMLISVKGVPDIEVIISFGEISSMGYVDKNVKPMAVKPAMDTALLLSEWFKYPIYVRLRDRLKSNLLTYKINNRL